MKKLIILGYIGIFIGLSSCNKEDEFPNFLKTHATTMNADGGSVTVNAKREFMVAGIMFITVKDTCTYSYPIDNYEVESQVKWIKLKFASKKMLIIADPNTTGEERKAVITLQNSNTFNDFTITQSK